MAASTDGTDAPAYVEGLDGAERKLLLCQIADTWPEVVISAAQELAERRAATAERRRVSRNRKATERQYRKRAAAK